MKVKEKTKIVYSMKVLCGGVWPAMLCREGGHTCMAWQATPCHTHAKKKKSIYCLFFNVHIYVYIYMKSLGLAFYKYFTVLKTPFPTNKHFPSS